MFLYSIRVNGAIARPVNPEPWLEFWQGVWNETHVNLEWEKSKTAATNTLAVVVVR